MVKRELNKQNTQKKKEEKMRKLQNKKKNKGVKNEEEAKKLCYDDQPDDSPEKTEHITM